MSRSNTPELIIWGIYAVVTGVCLLGTAVAFSNSLGYGIVPGVVFAILGAALVAVLSRGVHKLSQKVKLQEQTANKKTLWIVIECLILLGILVGMVLVRLPYSWDVAGHTVYETLQIKAEGADFSYSHGGYGLYLYLVNASFLLLGNHTYAPIVLQLILLVCAGVSLYFGVRRIAGVIAALLTVSFLGFAPYMIIQTCSLTPFLVVLFFYGLALICIGGISYSMSQTNSLPDQIAALFCYVTSGMLIGLCCYLDVAGVSLLVIMTAAVCYGDNLDLDEKEPEIGFSKILRNPMIVFLSIIFFAAFMFGCLHGEFADVSKQLALYAPQKFQIPVTVAEPGGFAEGVLIVALLAFGVFGFWFDGRMGRRSVWLFVTMLLAGMQCFGISAPEYFNGLALVYLLCIILAGCGITEVLMSTPRIEEAVKEESDMAIIDMDAPNESVTTQDVVHEIEYIENPLPLPKKHVKKVMDYDLEVAEDDDFDI